MRTTKDFKNAVNNKNTKVANALLGYIVNIILQYTDVTSKVEEL